MPAFVDSVTTITGTGTSIVLPVPGSPVAGDLLLAFIGNDGLEGNTPPSGWTTEADDLGSFSELRSGIYSRVATASEPADYTWTLSGSQEFVAGMLLIKGVASPFLDVAISANIENNVSSPRALSVITVNDDVLVFRSVMMDSSHKPFTPVGAETNHVEIEVASGVTLHVVSEAQATAGATGDFDFDPTGLDQATSYTVPIRSFSNAGEVQTDASVEVSQNSEVFAVVSIEVQQRSDGEVFAAASMQAEVHGQVSVDASIAASQNSEVNVVSSVEALQNEQVSVVSSVEVLQNGQVSVAASMVNEATTQFGEVFADVSINAAPNGQVQTTASINLKFQGEVSADASVQAINLAAVQVDVSIQTEVHGVVRFIASIFVIQNGQVTVDASVSAISLGAVQADGSINTLQNAAVTADVSINVVSRVNGQVQVAVSIAALQNNQVQVAASVQVIPLGAVIAPASITIHQNAQITVPVFITVLQAGGKVQIVASIVVSQHAEIQIVASVQTQPFVFVDSQIQVAVSIQTDHRVGLDDRSGVAEKAYIPNSGRFVVRNGTLFIVDNETLRLRQEAAEGFGWDLDLITNPPGELVVDTNRPGSVPLQYKIDRDGGQFGMGVLRIEIPDDWIKS